MISFKNNKLVLSLAASLIISYSSAAFATPGTPVIAWMPDSHNSGSVNVQWDMWWGENGKSWNLTANNTQQCEGDLINNGKQAQKGQCDVNLTEGVYNLQVELCNDSGCTLSERKSIAVNASNTGSETPADPTTPDTPTPITDSNKTPADPVIAWMPTSYQLNGDSVAIDLTWDMWWGVNGDHWKLLQNGQVIHTGTLTAQTDNSAQTASQQITLNNTGNYEFSVELCNGEGSEEVCSVSDTIALSVTSNTSGSTPADPVDPLSPPDDPTTPPNDSIDPVVSGWPLQEYNVAYNNTSGKVVASYFVEWGVYGRNYHVADIPATNLTHVLYGFIAICGENPSALPGTQAALNNECADQADDTVTFVDRYATLEKSYPGDKWDDPVRGNFGQLIKMKQQVPGIKILPSIGGWTLSDPFFDIVNNPSRKATFVASAVDFVRQYDFFDGIDIDWEFPGGNGANPNLGSSADAQGFADLMSDLRVALDQLELETGRDYELTAAMNVSEGKVNNVNYQQAAPYMDYVFAMSYDFYGAWNNEIGHHTALFPTTDGSNAGLNVIDGVTNLINAGVPANKIVVGAGMYGRGWKGVKNGQGNGPIDGTWEAGVLDYKDIEVNYLGGLNGVGINGFDYSYDETAQAPSLYRESTGELITYDNPRSVRAKGEAVIINGLAGLFSWEIDADNGHILNAMHQGLNHPRTDGLSDDFEHTDGSGGGNLGTGGGSGGDTGGGDTGGGGTDVGTDVGTDTGENSFYNINLSTLQSAEYDLTNSDLMQKVKLSIATLDNAEVELIQPGRSANPGNVKRLEEIISSSDWDYIFPRRAPEYTYINFLKAVGKFPSMCGDYDDGRNAEEICRKSLATMFAHFAQETGGHTKHWVEAEWRQGLHWIREMGWTEEMRGGYNGECNPDVWQGQTWPCGKFDDGEFKSYFGRGAKQLSYNYNYGPFSEAMFGTVDTLLDNPEMVADTWLNLASAVFFYVYPQPPKPSMLHVVDGTWQPNSRDLDNGLVPGFGVSTQIINGGVECGGSVEIQQSVNRIDYYRNFAQYLNVPVPASEVMGCKGMRQFDADGSGALPIYWEQDWSWSTETADGQSYACQLVGYQTPFSSFKEGDYALCVDHHFDVNIDYDQ